MSEILKKIDEDTLEITTTYVQQIEKEELERRKKELEQDILRAEEEITKINNQLNILK